MAEAATRPIRVSFLPRRRRLAVARERIFVAAKWLRSFFRSRWRAIDYPVRLRPNGPAAGAAASWTAQIINWPGVGGVGATVDEAVARLGENLERIRVHRLAIGKGMPRPGTKVPLQPAPAGRVNARRGLRNDFAVRVLGVLPGAPIFISDETSLEHFGAGARAAGLRTKILEVYGVDVSDLKDGLVCDILDRIWEAGEKAATSSINFAEYLYLRSIDTVKGQALRVVVQEAVTARTAKPIEKPAGELGKLFSDARPIRSDENCRSFELVWPSYITYAVTKENQARVPAKETYDGRLLRCYRQSEFSAFVAKSALDFTSQAGPFIHWGLITLNEIVDVASRDTPQVRRLSDPGD